MRRMSSALGNTVLYAFGCAFLMRLAGWLMEAVTPMQLDNLLLTLVGAGVGVVLGVFDAWEPEEVD